MSTSQSVESFAPTATAGRWAWLLLGVTLLGAVLRFVAIGHQSLWYDEAFTESVIRRSYVELAMGDARDNGTPPLYYLLAKPWREAFGDSEAALRSLPALFGILTIPLLGILGRRLLGPTAGLIAAALLAVSPTAVELSNDARTYPLGGLLAVLSTIAFLGWIETGRRRHLIALAVTLALAWYSHYYLFTMPLAQAAALAFLPRDRRRDLGWLAAVAIAAILWMPWLPALAAQVGTPGNLRRMGDAWRLQFLATPLVFAFGRSLVWRESGAIRLGLATLAAVVAFWWPAGWGLSRLRGRPAVAALIGAWLAVPILGPLGLAIALTPIYATRYASVGLPAFLLLAACGLADPRIPGRRIVLGLIVALTATSLARYAAYPIKDDWRSVSNEILDGIRDGEIVATYPEYETLCFRYYATRPGRRVPDTVIRLYEPPGPSGVLLGAVDNPDDPGPRIKGDITDRFLDAPGVWIGLRTIADAPSRYVDFLTKRGFDLERRRSGYQIDLLHFVKRQPSR